MAQQLIAAGQKELFYWRRKGGRAELDFLCEIGDGIIPLEVKAGVNPRSKSLKSYDNQFAPPCLARTTLLNLKLGCFSQGHMNAEYRELVETKLLNFLDQRVFQVFAAHQFQEGLLEIDSAHDGGSEVLLSTFEFDSYRRAIFNEYLGNMGQ